VKTGGAARLSLQPTALGLDEAPRERQTDPVPVHPVPTTSEQRGLGQVDAGTVVSDVDGDGVGGLTSRDGHGAAAVQHGVVEQHTQHLADRADGRERLRGTGLQFQPQVSAVGAQPAAPVVVELGEQHVEHHRLRRGGVARQGEQFVDGLLEAVGVDEARPHRPPQIPVGPFQHGLEPQAQAGQGGPQLVRGVGGERPFAGQQVVEPTGCSVEGATDGVDLGHVTRPGPDAEVPLTEPPGGHRQLFQRGGQPPGLPARH
jgi:hypothetical protein